MPSRLLCSGLALLALGSAWPSTARASELELRLDSECEGPSIVEVLEERLGRALDPERAALIADVALHRRGERVRVAVGLSRGGARSERAFWADDCAAGVRAAALVLALALDADGAARPPAPSIGGAEVALVPALSAVRSVALEPVERPPERAAPPHEESDTPVSAMLLAGAVLDGGTAPDLQAGARVGVALAVGGAAALRVALEATYLPEQRLSSALGAAVEVTVLAATLRVGGMLALGVPRTQPGALSIGGGAELVLGAAIGRGVGVRVQDARGAALPWLAARATLAAELTLVGPLALRATGSVGLPLVAPRFRVVGVPSVRPARDVLMEGALLLAFRFP